MHKVDLFGDLWGSTFNALVKMTIRSINNWTVLVLLCKICIINKNVIVNTLCYVFFYIPLRSQLHIPRIYMVLFALYYPSENSLLHQRKGIKGGNLLGNTNYLNLKYLIIRFQNRDSKPSTNGTWSACIEFSHPFRLFWVALFVSLVYLLMSTIMYICEKSHIIWIKIWIVF